VPRVDDGEDQRVRAVGADQSRGGQAQQVGLAGAGVAERQQVLVATEQVQQRRGEVALEPADADPAGTPGPRTSSAGSTAGSTRTGAGTGPAQAPSTSAAASASAGAAGSGRPSNRGSATCAYSLVVVSARPGVSVGTPRASLPSIPDSAGSVIRSSTRWVNATCWAARTSLHRRAVATTCTPNRAPRASRSCTAASMSSYSAASWP
jgi:hypothetical protein